MTIKAIAFGGAIVLILPKVLFAQVVISEIMYDVEGSDSGREWVEVYNEGAEVNFTEWKLREGTINHGIVAQGSEMLPSGSYAVIADNPTKFKTDWPSYDGLLFDSAFSLNQTGETLILRCCGKALEDKDSVTYSSEMGGSNDGASLSKSGGTFVPTEPTPGMPPGAQKVPAAEPEPQSAPAQKLPEPKPAPLPAVKPAPEPEPAPTPVPEPESKPEPLPEPKPAPAVLSAQEVREARTAPASEAPKRPKESLPEPEPKVEAETVPQVTEESEGAQLVAAAAQSGGAKSPSNDLTWWLGAGAFSLAGAGAVMVIQRRRKREWDIVEETS